MPLPPTGAARISAKLLLSLSTCICAPAIGQDVEDAAQAPEIIVTAQRIRGSVDTDIPPIEIIGENDIASYGASTLSDIISAIAPQTASGRGRGGGMPIILLNGQRISGFRELRNLPPEAIKQVQVFPEELALKYGYRPDQRVINFILKDNFASASISVEYRIPDGGGFTSQELENEFTRIGPDTRTNIAVIYEQQSLLTENERDIIINPNIANFENAGDITRFRSLQPETERFEINGNWSRSLSPATNLSLNANIRVDDSHTLLGLPSASLLVPASSPFSQDPSDVTIDRFFAFPNILTRQVETYTAQAGFSFNSKLGPWQLALSGNYGHIDQKTDIVRNADFDPLRQDIINGTVDPYSADLGNDLSFLPPDINDSINETFTLANVISGDLFNLPAGPVQLTFRTGFNREILDSRSIRSSVENSTNLHRNDVNGAVNIEFPLIERGVGPLGFLGVFSVNANYGLSDLSDFGRLTEYGAGFRWAPVKDIIFQASVIGDENAPQITQLGNPIITTPNVAFFDFSRNETVFLDLLSGGNPDLIGEKRRDLKLSLNITPAKINGLNLQVEYFRNKSRNITSAFPLLTPEIEAAFPDRVTRDGNGQLIAIDQRPVNFDRETSRRIRWGFNFSRSFGDRPPAGGNAGRGRGAGRSGPPEAGQQGPKRPGQQTGGRPGRPNSRWQISIYHDWRLQQDILIRPGIAELDLLNGSATSFLGGAPRHEIDLSGGIFSNGLGMRIEGKYRNPTRANGSGLPGGSDLRFGDLATLNLRFFVNLDERGNLTKHVPFLKNSRIALRIDNILNDFITVRDQNGITPLSYQRGYLDPRGRLFELDFRKRF